MRRQKLEVRGDVVNTAEPLDFELDLAAQVASGLLENELETAEQTDCSLRRRYTGSDL